jgi:hypothetical protein
MKEIDKNCKLKGKGIKITTRNNINKNRKNFMKHQMRELIN